MKLKSFLLTSFVLSCGHKTSNDRHDQVPASSNIDPKPASCLFLSQLPVPPYVDPNVDNSKAFVQVCYEGKEFMSQKFCEMAGPHIDKELKFYRLFENTKNCPTEQLTAKCVFHSQTGQEDSIIWIYDNSQIDTDIEVIRKSCNVNGEFFSLK